MVSISPRAHGRAVAALLWLGFTAPAAAEPVPPCPEDARPVAPAYGPVAGAPAIGIWHDVRLDVPADCPGASAAPVRLVMALAGRFRHAGTADDLARRIGAVSKTRGTRYWSTTDGNWRTLISDSAALRSTDVDATRADFSPDEVMSGRPLFYFQDDTRSSGRNLYRLTARAAGSDRLVVEIVNLSPIRLWLVTLFDPETLVSVHVLDRLGPGIWGYYGLTVVHDGAGGGSEKSFVNRAASYYRFLTGVPTDRDPPLAP